LFFVLIGFLKKRGFQMDKNKNNNGYWVGKKAKIEILKDGRKLIFTAEILESDGHSISFLDREGLFYSFNKELIKENFINK